MKRLAVVTLVGVALVIFSIGVPAIVVELTGCTVGPGFEFADFELLRDDPVKSELLEKSFPDLIHFL